jgi:hypothetical protein
MGNGESDKTDAPAAATDIPPTVTKAIAGGAAGKEGTGRPAEPSGDAHSAGPGAAPEEEVMTPPVHSVRFNCLVDVAYQAGREAFFAALARWFEGTQALFGTAAVGAALGGSSILTGAAAIVGAVAAVGQLVADPAGAARDSRVLRSRYLDILAEMEETEATDAACAKWRARMQRITADEGPTYRAAQALAYNEVIDSIFAEPEAARKRLLVPASERRLAHWRRFGGRTFAPAGDG